MAEPIYRYGIKLTPRGNHNLQFRKPKLEIGTVSTDWSPAPEDPDKDAMELISVLQTDFSVVQGQIQAKVWETDIEKATEGVYENITEIYSYINETVNSITAEVGDLTYIVENNYEYLTAQISDLIVTSTEITSTVSDIETALYGNLNAKNLLSYSREMSVSPTMESSDMHWVVVSDSGAVNGYSAYIVAYDFDGNDRVWPAIFDTNNLMINKDSLNNGTTYTFSFYLRSVTSTEESYANYNNYLWNNFILNQSIISTSIDSVITETTTAEKYDVVYPRNTSFARISVTFTMTDVDNFIIQFAPYWWNTRDQYSCRICGMMLNEGNSALNWDEGNTSEYVTTKAFFSQLEQLSTSITATVADIRTDLDGNVAALYSQIEMLSTSITATVADLENDVYARITELSDSITATVADLEYDVYSRITQISNGISLTVSSKTNGSASIVMTVDGKESGGDLYSNGLRNAFANDTSAITISAGTITFNSNTFIVNSTYFSVTADGTITATAGTIGGWTIGTNALYSGPSSLTSTTNGLCLYSGSNGGLRVNFGDDGALLRYGYLIFYRGSNERSYISGNSYYTSTGVFGLRLAGYGIIAMMTPYLMSCPTYYAHDVTATGYIGYSGALSVLTNTGSYVTLTFYNGICCG